MCQRSHGNQTWEKSRKCLIMAPRNNTDTELVFVFSIELFGQGKSIHTADTFKHIFRIWNEFGPSVFCMAAQGGKMCHFSPHNVAFIHFN